ncbi:polysaccharide deacetylase family protein [candidate division TA06 bacterium]|nr:polysaccharide deacetylase family protein [candidate division TA06 bacterium]
MSGPKIPEPLPTRLNVALLKSDYTSNFFKEKRHYEQILSKWKTFLSDMEIEHQDITDSDLERGELGEFTVLILPVALCLSDGERSAIRDFLSEGKGVVASWAIGSRSQEGEWVGWGFLEEYTGSKFADYLEKKAAVWVTFIGNSPLSVGVDPGFRMELYRGQEMGIIRTSRDAYWSDWSLNPQTITEEPNSDVAVAHGNYHEGRMVWFGFNVTEVIEDSVDQMVLKRFLLNAIHWTGRIPMSEVWYWPGSYQGAAVFAQDVEHQFENSANAAKILEKEGIPGTFFCISDLAIHNPDLVKTFAEIGEVGSHSDDSQVFKGQPFNLQLKRMKKTVADLKKIIGVKVKGIRPPQELFDEGTLKAWATVGGEYLFANPNFKKAVPELVTLEGNLLKTLLGKKVSLVIIPRVVIDDYDVFVTKSLTNKEEILRLYQMDFEKIYNLNGLYMFSYHSQHLSSPEHVEILASMVKYTKTYNLWFATAHEVSRWWKSRSKISTEIYKISDNRLILSVKNLNSGSIANLSVVVYLPRSPKTLEIKSDFSHIPSPDHHLEESKLVVSIETLNPNSIQTYTIILQEVFAESLRNPPYLQDVTY